MSNTEYNSLYERYKFMPEDELSKLTVENGYTELAEKVAKDILNSGREEYHQKIHEQELIETELNELSEARRKNPLYDDIHQIANDIRFIKNFIICCTVISIIAYILFQIKIM